MPHFIGRLVCLAARCSSSYRRSTLPAAGKLALVVTPNDIGGEHSGLKHKGFEGKICQCRIFEIDAQLVQVFRKLVDSDICLVAGVLLLPIEVGNEFFAVFRKNYRR